jgi:hypothetical protein
VTTIAVFARCRQSFVLMSGPISMNKCSPLEHRPRSRRHCGGSWYLSACRLWKGTARSRGRVCREDTLVRSRAVYSALESESTSHDLKSAPEPGSALELSWVFGPRQRRRAFSMVVSHALRFPTTVCCASYHSSEASRTSVL